MINVSLSTPSALKVTLMDKIYYALGKIQGLKFNPGNSHSWLRDEKNVFALFLLLDKENLI